MKILFIKPPVNRGPVNYGYKVVEPPLGLMYLASFLKAHGYNELKITHMGVEKVEYGNLGRMIKEYNPEIVGISAMTAESLGMHEVARIAKESLASSIVIAGGPYPTGCAEDVLKDHNIDLVVRGEGEEVMLEIVKAIEEGKDFFSIQSISFRNNGSIVHAPRNTYIENLDVLPYPDWDAIHLEDYKEFTPQSLFLSGHVYMSLFTSRGCPFHCTFCHNIFGKKFRAHSPERVLEEIKYLNYSLGIVNFEIIDDIFNFDRTRAIAIMQGIIENNLKIRLFFVNGVRGDMLDEELIDLFAKAGVVYMSIAVETASPRLQREIGKSIALEKTRRIISYAARKKIFVNGFFMLGFPKETLREIVSTIKFAVTSRLHSASFFLVHPFKGTAIGDLTQALGRQVITIGNKSNYYFFVTNDSVTCSELSNKQLQLIFSLANILFYSNPLRIIRIINHLPNKKILRQLIFQFTRRALGWMS